MLSRFRNAKGLAVAQITGRGRQRVLKSSFRTILGGQLGATSRTGRQCKRGCARFITNSVWLNDENAVPNIQKGPTRFDQRQNESFSRHWHFWNFMLSLTPAAFTLYYLHFVVRKDMHETARRLKNESSETDVAHDNSIRGRRKEREGERQRKAAVSNETMLDDVQQSNSELQRKMAALEKKLDSIVADLNRDVESREEDAGAGKDGNNAGQGKEE